METPPGLSQVFVLLPWTYRCELGIQKRGVRLTSQVHCDISKIISPMKFRMERDSIHSCRKIDGVFRTCCRL